MCTVPVLSRVCRESYNEPLAVYESLKRRGMGLVTVTDHDSIDAAEQLARYPDFFLSEEVSAVTPSGTNIHVGVYDIRESDHHQMQRRRNDLPSLLEYLNARRLFYTINHAFSGLTGRRSEEDFTLFASGFPGVETRNGQMLAKANALAHAFARRHRKVRTGGSDAHTLSSLGRTFTEVAGARSRQEFFDGLRAGRGRVAGEPGSYWKLTRAVWEIGTHLARELPWTLALAPLFLAVPAVTAVNYLLESSFARKWAFVTRPRKRTYGRSVTLTPSSGFQEI
jgi:predicted metal-dependent phosphoesterase TrpH